MDERIITFLKSGHHMGTKLIYLSKGMFSYYGLKYGAGDRNRTGMALRPRDFKSLAYACFATPAWGAG